MSRLLLVRHALTRQDRTRNAREWALDPAGSAAVALLAARTEFENVVRVASSSEPKALATAAAISQANGLPTVEPFEGLQEIHKAGWVENHDAVIADLFAFPERPAAPGWETASHAQSRFHEAMERLISETVGDLLVVSHGIVLSLYLARLRGQERVRFADWQAIRMPDLAVLDRETMHMVQPFGG